MRDFETQPSAMVTNPARSGRVKREDRKEKEREAARKSRKKKKEMFQTMMQEVTQLRSEVERLREQNHLSELALLASKRNKLLQDVAMCLASNAYDEDGFSDLVRKLSEVKFRACSSLSRYITNLQEILVPIREFEMPLWLMRNLVNFERVEVLHEDPVRAEGYTSEIQVLIADLIGSCGLDPEQRDALRDWFEKHSESALKLSSILHQIRAMTLSLDDLRVQWEQLYHPFMEGVESILNVLDPSQKARFLLWKQKHKADCFKAIEIQVASAPRPAVHVGPTNAAASQSKETPAVSVTPPAASAPHQPVVAQPAARHVSVAEPPHPHRAPSVPEASHHQPVRPQRPTHPAAAATAAEAQPQPQQPIRAQKFVHVSNQPATLLGAVPAATPTHTSTTHSSMEAHPTSFVHLSSSPAVARDSTVHHHKRRLPEAQDESSPISWPDSNLVSWPDSSDSTSSRSCSYSSPTLNPATSNPLSAHPPSALTINPSVNPNQTRPSDYDLVLQHCAPHIDSAASSAAHCYSFSEMTPTKSGAGFPVVTLAGHGTARFYRIPSEQQHRAEMPPSSTCSTDRPHDDQMSVPLPLSGHLVRPPDMSWQAAPHDLHRSRQYVDEPFVVSVKHRTQATEALHRDPNALIMPPTAHVSSAPHGGPGLCFAAPGDPGLIDAVVTTDSQPFVACSRNSPAFVSCSCSQPSFQADLGRLDTGAHLNALGTDDMHPLPSATAFSHGALAQQYVVSIEQDDSALAWSHGKFDTWFQH